jgi:hypothetical protein
MFAFLYSLFNKCGVQRSKDNNYISIYQPVLIVAVLKSGVQKIVSLAVFVNSVLSPNSKIATPRLMTSGIYGQ